MRGLFGWMLDIDDERAFWTDVACLPALAVFAVFIVFIIIHIIRVHGVYRFLMIWSSFADGGTFHLRTSIPFSCLFILYLFMVQHSLFFSMGFAFLSIAHPPINIENGQ
jgi:hypothetical protein